MADAAAIHRLVAADGIEKSGFARAVGADDGDKFAGGNVKLMPRKAGFSIGVPGLKVISRFWRAS
jgi:hypothetical protein